MSMCECLKNIGLGNQQPRPKEGKVHRLSGTSVSSGGHPYRMMI